ncbi:hypothetical protein CFK37_19455 [Virgibacillus phasianinus]|uniref:Uncharacterized protein n=1 Tax=Virgibacillus phasianinus TaxID=2017483 RepID=A0A220U7U0_9BACI|nr:hypothetical protein CFK37_19455 [Virgibacillus phasianinus]
MRKGNMGYILGMIGVASLVMSYVVPARTNWWGLFLGISIVLNLLGIVFLMLSLKELQKSEGL